MEIAAKRSRPFETVIGTDLSVARDWLKKGETIGMPTETVYGLAANALDPEAVMKIFTVKNRPSFDPLIVHIDSPERVLDYATEFNETARHLAKSLWPGPLTLLLPKKAIVPDEVTSGLERVALRVPSHPVALELLKGLDFPLAAPSANPFGYVSPTTAQHVCDQLGGKVPYVLQGGTCDVGVESTIVGFEASLSHPDGDVVVYRLGGVPVETLKRLCGENRVVREAGPLASTLTHNSSSSSSSSGSSSKEEDIPAAAPGMLTSHYAPRKKLTLIERGETIPLQENDNIRVGLISVIQRENGSYGARLAEQKSLCPSGSVQVDEAARNLFGVLRSMDASEDCDVIYAERCPEEGLGRAVNDRLKRAAAKR